MHPTKRNIERTGTFKTLAKLIGSDRAYEVIKSIWYTDEFFYSTQPENLKAAVVWMETPQGHDQWSEWHEQATKTIPNYTL